MMGAQLIKQYILEDISININISRHLNLEFASTIHV